MSVLYQGYGIDNLINKKDDRVREIASNMLKELKK